MRGVYRTLVEEARCYMAKAMTDCINDTSVRNFGGDSLLRSCSCNR
jgi:hypothetical protein